MKWKYSMFRFEVDRELIKAGMVEIAKETRPFLNSIVAGGWEIFETHEFNATETSDYVLSVIARQEML